MEIESEINSLVYLIGFAAFIKQQQLKALGPSIRLQSKNYMA